MSCAAALPAALADRAEQLTGLQVCELLSLTEAGGILAMDTAGQKPVRGSVGYPLPFVEIEARRMQLDGSAGSRCEVNEIGVLVSRGPNVSAGYKDVEQNVAAFTEDGWLVSGDLGFLDESGRVILAGRTKDLIICNGRNIDPKVIEDALLSHEAVAAAGVVALPDADEGELPVAFVVLKPEQTLTSGALQLHVAQRLGHEFAVPRMVFSVDNLPYGAIGEVYKPALRMKCATDLFLGMLKDEPLRSLSINENARRGTLLAMELKVPAEQAAAVQSRIAEKLAPFLVTISWTETATQAQ